MTASFRFSEYSGYHYRDFAFVGRGWTGDIWSHDMDDHRDGGVIQRSLAVERQRTDRDEIPLGELVHSMYLMSGSKARSVSFNDAHRFVGTLYAPDLDTMKINALRFADEYTHLFIKNAYSSVLNRETRKNPTLADWQSEFKLIGEMAQLVEGGNSDLLTGIPARQTLEELGYSRDWIYEQYYWTGHQPLIQRKLDYQCSPQIIDISRDNSGNYQTQLVPESLSGYLWLLIARDAADSITYSLCEGCGVRETPGISPSGQRTQYCKQACKTLASRKGKYSQRREMNHD